MTFRVKGVCNFMKTKIITNDQIIEQVKDFIYLENNIGHKK